MRDVRRLELEGSREVEPGGGDVLTGQRVHEIEVEVGEARGMQLLGGAPRLGGRMNAPERLEPLRIEALGAERYARDAGRPVVAECAALDRARVGFERHLETRGELEHAARRREELADRAR